jgi:hypothetical protein
MARGEPLKIAVLGAGPVGIEAALQMIQLGHNVTIYERGDIGQHVLSWGHVRMFSPFGWNSTPLGLETLRKENPKQPLPAAVDLITGTEFLERYLLPLALIPPLCDRFQLKTEVMQIGRAGFLKTDPVTEPKRAHAPFLMLLRDDKGVERIEETQVILDCTGTYRNHRNLGEGGILAPGERACEKQIAYGLEDILGAKKNHYANKSIFVMGSGFSAATTVSQLATLAEDNSATWVFWAARGSRSTPLPRMPGDALKERDRLAARANSLATRGDGNLEFHAGCAIQSIESLGGDKGFSIQARCAGKPMNWVVDRLIANVGFQADESMTRELHLLPFDQTPGTVKQPEPGYFVLGMKSHGRNSGFLLKRGQEQIKEVATLLGARK